MTVPSDVESEAAVIAAALVDRDSVAGLVESLEPGHFWRSEHRQVWEAVVELWNGRQEVNYISVGDALRRKGSLEEFGGLTRLIELQSNPALILTESSVAWYAAQVRATAASRRVMEAAALITRLVQENPGEPERAITRGVELLMQAEGGSLQGQTATIGEILRDGLAAEIEGFLENPRAAAGLLTGWWKFDQLLGGVVPGRVYVVGAETSMGKSIFVSDLAKRLTLKGARALVFTTEMGKAEVARRIVWQQAGVDPYAIRQSGWSMPEEREAAREAMVALDGLPLAFCERGRVSAPLIRSEIRRQKARFGGLDLVVWDHVDMGQGSGARRGGSRTNELEEITADVKAAAVDEQVAFVEVSHLARATENRAGGRLARLRNSGSKEQDADVVLFLVPVKRGPKGDWVEMTSEEARPLMASPGRVDVRLHIEKNRHGPVGYVPLVMDWAHGGRFHDRDEGED